MTPEPWQLKMLESQKRLLEEVRRADAIWTITECDDHAAGKWAQHAIVLSVLDIEIKFIGDLERYVPDKKRSKGPLAAPLMALRDALATLREGKVSPLLQPCPNRPAFSPITLTPLPQTGPMAAMRELQKQLADLRRGIVGPLLVPAL